LNVPRGITARDFTRALETDGFSLNRITGSHHIYTHLDGRIVPVAYTRESDTFPIRSCFSQLTRFFYRENPSHRDFRRNGISSGVDRC